MSRFVLFLGSTLLVSTLTACKQAVPPERNHDANVRELRDAETQWNEDLASRNISRLVAHYAEDAVLMTSGEPASAGPEAIRKTLEQLVSDPALSLKVEPTKVEVATSGDLGYTQGSYTLTVTNPVTKQPISDHGSYVTTYRKQADGTWKAVADIETSGVSPTSQVDAPATPPKKK